MAKEVKVVTASEVEPRAMCKGATVRRLITKRREGSEKLMLGIATFEPGCEEHEFAYPDKDEVYYVMKGTLEFQWEDKKIDVHEGQAVFMPAGLRYREVNRTREPVVVVYTLTPPLE